MSVQMEDEQIEAYIGALDEDCTDAEDNVVLTTEALNALLDADAFTKHVIKNNSENENDGDETSDTHGTIIMDADGNYYFHTSKGAIEVKPLKFKSPSKVLKMKRATVVKQGIKRIKLEEPHPESKTDNNSEIKKMSPGEKSVNDDNQTLIPNESTNNQEALNTFDLIIPEGEEEFYSTSNTDSLQREEQKQQQEKQETSSTELSLQTMVVYDCKNCSFKTNNEQLFENHSKMCVMKKEIKKDQDKPQECEVNLEKRKVGRPRKLTTTTSKNIETKNKPQKMRQSKLKKDRATCSNKKNEITNEIANNKDDVEFQSDPDYIPESNIRVRSEIPTKSLKKGNNSQNHDELKCPHCPYTTIKRLLFSRHLKTHSGDCKYKCSICEKGFKTNASLQNHVNTHLGKKPYPCKECGKSFTTSGELVRHSRYRHTGVRPHKCTECDYASVEMSKLKRHMRCHTGERPYQCPHCTYASPDSFKLKRHMRTHTGEKPYECDICHARFTQSNSLKYHRLIHSVNEKPVFQCPLCPTTCGRKTDLRLHIQNLHSRDKVWPCNRCGKELPDRYSLKMHIKTHEGEKCFQCRYCPYASALQRHLNIHMLLHTDEKPFKCETCEMPFRQKMLLQRHINVYHSNNYVPPKPREKTHACPHCSKAFCFKGNLIRHMEVHDPSVALEQRQFELKIGRLVRVMGDNNKNTNTTITTHNDDGDVEESEKKEKGSSNYNDDDINAAMLETFDDQDEIEYQQEVADDEYDVEAEVYDLYEEIEDDENNVVVVEEEEEVKIPSTTNSIRLKAPKTTTTTTATTIVKTVEKQQKAQEPSKEMSKQFFKEAKERCFTLNIEEKRKTNVKSENQSSLMNIVLIEITQCNDESFNENNGKVNEQIIIQEVMDEEEVNENEEMIPTNAPRTNETNNKKKQKKKQESLNEPKILDNSKNLTINNYFGFEEEGDVTALINDSNEHPVDYFEITETI